VSNVNTIQQIVDRLATITPERASLLLDETIAVDSKAGIIIVKLEDMPAMEGEDGQDYRFYVARVLPAGPDGSNYVNPHVHYRGEEPYHFLSGADGEMNSGRIFGGEVRWNRARRVQPGDTVVIGEGEVHSFRNNGTEPADFAFACPDSHLIDADEEHPEGDRRFTKDLDHGIPPWYRT
jgi:mannose-6-phosphate isomerase-like protein (cupin superfamily)